MNPFELIQAQALALMAKLALILLPVLVAGLALYFQSLTFRRIVNLINPPRNQARYGRGGRVYKSGYAFNEQTARWVYVHRNVGSTHKKRRYTVYQHNKR